MSFPGFKETYEHCWESYVTKSKDRFTPLIIQSSNFRELADILTQASVGILLEDGAIVPRDQELAELKIKVAAYDYLLRQMDLKKIEVCGKNRLELERDSFVRDIALTDPAWADIPLLRPYTASGNELGDKRVCCAVPYRTIGGSSQRIADRDRTGQLEDQGFYGMRVISPGVVSLQDLESLVAEMGSSSVVRVYCVLGEGNVEVDVDRSLRASGFDENRDFSQSKYIALRAKLRSENDDPEQRIRIAREIGGLMSRPYKVISPANALGQEAAERKVLDALDDPAWNV